MLWYKSYLHTKFHRPSAARTDAAAYLMEDAPTCPEVDISGSIFVLFVALHNRIVPRRAAPPFFHRFLNLPDPFIQDPCDAVTYEFFRRFLGGCDA
jgi:hypothetical protein